VSRTYKTKTSLRSRLLLSGRSNPAYAAYLNNNGNNNFAINLGFLILEAQKYYSWSHYPGTPCYALRLPSACKTRVWDFLFIHNAVDNAIHLIKMKITGFAKNNICHTLISKLS
jgi:hypothetical protein